MKPFRALFGRWDIYYITELNQRNSLSALKLLHLVILRSLATASPHFPAQFIVWRP